MGKVLAISISKEKGVPKTNIPKAKILKNFGIKGDAHAGKWEKQVSFLDKNVLEIVSKITGKPIAYGELAENITTDLDLSQIRVGDLIKINDCIFEVTQIGKDCKKENCTLVPDVKNCEVKKRIVFTKVLKGGEIKIGDCIEIIKTKRS